jgi:hypothetical protein
LGDQSCGTLQCRDKRGLVKYAMQCKKNAPEKPGRSTGSFVTLRIQERQVT